MNDLIWIGNSLYPREFLLALAIVAIMIVIVLVFLAIVAAHGLRWLARRLTDVNNRN